MTDAFDLGPYMTQRLPWAVGESSVHDFLNDSLTRQLVAAHLQDIARNALTALAQIPELEMQMLLTGSKAPREDVGVRDVLLCHHPFKGDKKYILAPRDADTLLRLYPGEPPKDGHYQVDAIQDNDKSGVTVVTLAPDRTYVFHREAGNLEYILQFQQEESTPLLVPILFRFYHGWRKAAGLKVRG